MFVGLGLSFKNKKFCPFFHLRLILPQTSTVTTQYYDNRIFLVRIGTCYWFRFITTGEENQNRTQHFCLKKVKATSMSPKYTVSTKAAASCHMAVLTSTPNIKYTVPLTKYPSTHSQAIVDVDKYLGHCLCFRTCLMIPVEKSINSLKSSSATWSPGKGL